MGRFFLLLALTFCSLNANCQPIKVYKTNVVPVFDGDTSDNCWKYTNWNNINHTWIPYNNTLPSSFTTESGTQTISGQNDFKGRYKVLWNENANQLLFLVEITDDFFIDGYIFPQSGYSNFDVLELFVDEDFSRGNHLFNTTNTLSANAFSYHMMVPKPSTSGLGTSMSAACDIWGSSWGNYSIVDYKNHFPNFSIKNIDNQHFIYEFSLKTYNTSFVGTSLYEGKTIGFTMAYCDNDQTDNLRDSFIGSVSVSGANNNDSYFDADIFGTLSLVGNNLPSAPLSFTGQKFNDSTVVFSWAASSNAISYKVFSQSILIGSTTGNYFTFSGLSFVNDYEFKLWAFNLFGDSTLAHNTVLIANSKPILIVNPTSLTGSLSSNSSENTPISVIGINIRKPVFFKLEFNDDLPCFSLITTTGSNNYISSLPKEFFDSTLKLYTVMPCINGVSITEDWFIKGKIKIYTEYSDTSTVYFDYKNEGVSLNINSLESNNLTFYPNPTSDILYFNSDIYLEIYLYNSMGAQVLNKNNFNYKELDISHLNNGIYLISIKDRLGKVFKGKVLKK
jgi:hypothetical protein